MVSVCLLHGVQSFNRLKSMEELRSLLGGVVDVEAALAFVRVRFHVEDMGPVSVGAQYNFDMRGIVKCKPLG